jgi:hypothetical protein
MGSDTLSSLHSRQKCGRVSHAEDEAFYGECNLSPSDPINLVAVTTKLRSFYDVPILLEEAV